MKRNLSIAIAVVLLLGSGLVHGLWTERWGTSQALAEAGARVANVPMQIGDWTGETNSVDIDSFAQAGALTYWSRTYRHDTGKSVTVILMCGRAGRMAVHTPEVCYRGIGYETSGAISTCSIGDNPKAEFRTARFFREQGDVSQLRILWSWNDGNKWQAPASPRWEFRGEPYLFKLYLVREVTGETSNIDTDPAVEFLRELIPTLEKTLIVDRRAA